MENTKTERPKATFPFDPAIAREMRGLVDRCCFATVKRHCRSERSPIQFAVIVEPPNVLWEIGALMYDDGHFGRSLIKSIEFARLCELGSLRIAVDKPAKDGEGLALDAISDRQVCDVIYLPPAYVVRFTGWEASED